MKKNIHYLLIAIFLLGIGSCSKDDLISNTEPTQAKGDNQNEETEDGVWIDFGHNRKAFLKNPTYKKDTLLSGTRAVVTPFVKEVGNGLMAITTLTSEEDESKTLTRSNEQTPWWEDNVLHFMLLEPLDISQHPNFNGDLYDIAYEADMRYNYKQRKYDFETEEKTDEFEKIIDILKDRQHLDRAKLIIYSQAVSVEPDQNTKQEASYFDGEYDLFPDHYDEDFLPLSFDAYQKLNITVQAGKRAFIGASYIGEDDNRLGFLIPTFVDTRIGCKYYSPIPFKTIKGFMTVKNAPMTRTSTVTINNFFVNRDVASSKNFILTNSDNDNKTTIYKNYRADDTEIPATEEDLYKPTHDRLLTVYTSTPNLNDYGQYIYSIGGDNLMEVGFHVTDGTFFKYDLKGYNIYSFVKPDSRTELKLGYSYTCSTTLMYSPDYIIPKKQVSDDDQLLGIASDKEKNKCVVFTKALKSHPSAAEWAKGEYATKSLFPDKTISITDEQKLRGMDCDNEKFIEDYQKLNINFEDLPFTLFVNNGLKVKDVRGSVATTEIFKSDFAKPFLPSIDDWCDLVERYINADAIVYNKVAHAQTLLLDFLITSSENIKTYNNLYNNATLFNSNTPIPFLSLQGSTDEEDLWMWTSTEVWDDDTKTTASKALAIRFNVDKQTIEVKACPKTEKHLVRLFAKYDVTSPNSPWMISRPGFPK